ncbi:hypothetical protein PMAYCL1PPCAC_22186, partial [Pristionchus mayeri]
RLKRQSCRYSPATIMTEAGHHGNFRNRSLSLNVEVELFSPWLPFCLVCLQLVLLVISHWTRRIARLSDDPIAFNISAEFSHASIRYRVSPIQKNFPQLDEMR